MPPKKTRKPSGERRTARKASPSAKRKPAAKASARKAAPATRRKPVAGAKPKQAVRKAKPKRTATRAPKRPAVINVGDEVTFPASTQQPRADAGTAAAAPAGEHLSGLVCSIRDIGTGKTVKTATGDMNRYVFEVLDDRTFASGMSSAANSEGSAARGRVKALLQQLSRQKQMPTLWGAALAGEGLAGLDGWRIVRIHSPEVAPVAPVGSRRA